MTQQEKQAIIDSIHVNAANFEYIAKTGRINGTLHSELCRIIDLLSGLRKPSEPEANVGEAGKELVKRICEVLDMWERTDIDGIHSNEFNQVSTEIAALMKKCENHEESRKNSQPDKELIPMWQLKKVENILRLTHNYEKAYEKISAHQRMIVEAYDFVKQAISNYEKLHK